MSTPQEAVALRKDLRRQINRANLAWETMLTLKKDLRRVNNALDG